MQKSPAVSLNAVRVFAAAARHGSISLAAEELGVTPSAVSHQIKTLEQRLQVALFQRGSNWLKLTEAGRGLFEEASGGLAIIESALGNLLRDANEVAVRASVSLAVRWLIPALESFKTRHPQARISVETTSLSEVPLGPAADMAIAYRRIGHYEGPGEVLLTDLSQPLVAPSLLEKSGYRGPEDIARVPALVYTQDNWDWKLWAEQMAIPAARLRFADRFDIDDAALRAAVSGLGMVLSPRLNADTELRTGTLVPLPGFEAIELGRYYLILGARRDGMVRTFRSWLHAEARRTQTVGST